MSVEPYTIDVDQAVVDDLTIRLRSTRIVPSTSPGWEGGVDVALVAELAAYWADGYDWRSQEKMLNTLPQVMVNVGGERVHAVHAPGPSPDSPVLLLLHGWPDSFVRYARVVEPLRRRYTVVVPSLPGFGFTPAAPRAASASADLMAGLMTALGHERFLVAGGDVGAGVASALARGYGDRVRALHLTEVGYPTGQEDVAALSDAERDFAGFIQGWWFAEGAYAMLQATKPHAIGVALNDSPAGLLAWIVSFLNTGAPQHDVEAAVGGRDNLLTLAMLVWVTQTAGTAAETYRLEAAAGWGGPPPARVTVPTALTLFARDAQFPREWAERSHDIRRYRTLDVGGHLAPMEVPQLYVDDLTAAFDEIAG